MNLLHASFIAKPAIVLSPTVRIVIAAMQNQSVSSSPSAVEIAARTHRNLFIGYLAWIVFAALVSAFFTWMVWRSGNRQQDAAISATNERAAKLEKEAAQARAKQTEAELSLLKLQRFVREPRVVDPAKSRALLEKRPKGSVEIKYLDSVETERLANELQKTLVANGWNVSVQKVGTDVIHDAGIALMTGSKNVSTADLDESGRHKFFEEPGQTLFAFLDSCVEGAIGGWSTTRPDLDKNASVILVGPKVW